MEKLITRKEAAEILGISIATLDAARNNGLITCLSIPSHCIRMKKGFFANESTYSMIHRVHSQ